MNVEFSTEALADNASFRYLTSIAWLFADLRHQWVVDGEGKIRSSQWLLAEGDNNRRFFCDLAQKYARKLIKTDVVVGPVGSKYAQCNSLCRVPADLAERALRQPLLIVVENAKCDGAFIQKIVLRAGSRLMRRRLGDDGLDRLRKRWANPLGDDDWVRVVHGGGATTAQQIELAAEAEPNIARRIFVLVDSDTGSPGAPLQGTAGKVQQVCNLLSKRPELRLKLHILRKREVENYLPAGVLQHLNETAFESWQQLGVHQKNHNDLKQIFGSKLWRVLVEPKFEGHFHENAIRERAGESGRELDELVGNIANLI